MEKVKAFLKRDSDFLIHTILFLFCLIFGISKLVYDHRVSGIIIGLLCVIGVSILFFFAILKEFKPRIRENEVKKKPKKAIILDIIFLFLVWGFGLYRLFMKNDEFMVIYMPLFTYLLFRKTKQKP